MLYDIIIRLLSAAGLTIIINANGITTLSVVVSICVFLFMEISVIVNTKLSCGTLTLIPFFISIVYISLEAPSKYPIYIVATLILSGFTGIAIHLYERMTDYKKQLHRTRDDSIELEEALKNKNRALLLEQDQQVHLATLAERNRIARDIHDNVGHLLSRAILLLGAISTVNTDEKIAPQLKMLSDTLDESMEKMRSSVHDLHDDSIDLEKNITDILNELKGFTVNAELDLDEVLPTELKLTIIGILKEATTNIIKHSNGNTVAVILHKNNSFCTLSITDNGTLTDKQKSTILNEGYEGIGLTNIKNRASSLGGDAYFYINDGFTVYTRLPFKNTMRG
ncbi:Signal transduction histidine kinase [Pseudobutyrivibrio sp. OR37]|uniref:sensor histidine kinase n=1 Tax=Pseudobutyrivibrio sp. OR37 TaxID=1798186 RepID=UPI0008F37236|nr:histidine kinase [Pseudobutyrivibrio sp. OR37]SFI02584.1 Signal transduction histidine kinase [Pseudobutyrivibrio sp. OR37]